MTSSSSSNPLGELLLTDKDIERFDPEATGGLDLEDDDDREIDLELTAGYDEERGAYVEGTLRVSLD